MYNNILIISDNLFLCEEFEKIIDEIIYPNVKWTFSISPFSNFLMFSKSLKNHVYVKNLKND